MSSVGAYFDAKSQKSELRYRADIADINATILDSEARNILYAAGVEESRLRLAGAQAKGEQRNQMASSGIDMAGSNTAIARLTTSDLVTEVDANTMRANALRAAWGQRIAAGDQRRGAASMRASASTINPAMAGATSLISGAGQVASSWYTLNKEGAFSQTKPKTGTVTVGSGTGTAQRRMIGGPSTDGNWGW